ncbi:MAG: hypothetical protein IPH45_15250 [Bacteroidales bacterium]|nr:hypothetical protein [Bacteroidales bacterium]
MSIYAYYPGCCGASTFNMNNGGSLINNKNISMDASGGIYHVGIYDGSFVNNATGVINSSYQNYIKPASFSNSGTINVLNSSLELNPFTIGGIININPGAELRATGILTFDGSLINNNGNITAPFNFITDPAKVLKGTGTFSSSMVLNNTSTIEPGSSPGIFTVAGNYSQGDAALNIEIGGSNPGTEYDRLVITGTATISGTLNATEINGFNSQSLTSIDIITAGAVSGTFSQANLPTSWSVQYAANKVSLVKFFEFVYYRDADNDSYGNLSDTIHSFLAAAPPGYTVESTDCNDANAAVNPGATEICDGIDNDCDGNTDVIVTNGIVCGMAYSEGQSFTLTAPPGKVFTSVDFASYGTPDGTCGNFTLGSCHATSTKAIVESLVIGQNSVTLTQNYQIFGDPCGGVYKRFYVQASYSEFVSLSQTFYADVDGDGYGDPAITQLACSQPNGYVLNNTDCNDNSSAAYSGAIEICDGIDNDCDGITDTIAGNPVCPQFITLNLKLFLQGYYTGANTMRASLYDLAISTNPTETDSVVFNLWSPANLSNPAPDYSATAIVHSNGEVIVQYPSEVIGGSFFIAVRHRNHLETWSKTPITLTGSTTYHFDSPVKAFGDNLFQMPDGQYVIYGGDVSQDGIVDGSDMAAVDNTSTIVLTGYVGKTPMGMDSWMDRIWLLIDNNATMAITAILP